MDALGMGSGLEHLLAEGVISEVLARLQSGKEAEVYVVLFGGKVVAAKVYKDRATRSFKNNSAYKEGRTVRNSRSQRAIERGSSFGKAAAEDAWKTAEADALYKLHAADVRVPTPVLYLDGVLLMELVLNGEGNAARRIIDTDLTPAQANLAYHDMIGQLVRILACDLIHGDLSPYNVLWAAAGPTIIDFPQIISASHNSSSEQFFLRDADNILGHFARIDRSLQGRRGDPWEIWQAYRRRELTPDFRPSGHGRGPRPAPRTFTPHAPQTSPPSHSHPARAPHVAHGPRNDAPRTDGPRRDGPAQTHRGDRPPAAQPSRRGGGGGGYSHGGHGAPGQGGGSHGHRGVRTPEVIVRPLRPTGGAPPSPSASAPTQAHHAGAASTASSEASGGGSAPHRRRRRRR
jgi:RIO kinase 1